MIHLLSWNSLGVFGMPFFQQELIIHSWPGYNLLLKIGRYTTCKWWWWWWWLKKDFWNVIITRMLGKHFDQHFFPKWVGWYILDLMELTSSLVLKIEWVGMLRPKFSGGVESCCFFRLGRLEDCSFKFVPWNET